MKRFVIAIAVSVMAFLGTQGIALAADAPTLTYSGGPVLAQQLMYTVFWGDWNFTDRQGYTGATAKKYINDMLLGWGGSADNNVTTQYCSGAAIGATSCAGVDPSLFITNYAGTYNTSEVLPGGQSWSDPNIPPCDVQANPCVTSSTAVQQEAINAAFHFCRWQGRFGCASSWQYWKALVVVILPPSTSIGYCGYHSFSASGGPRGASVIWAGVSYSEDTTVSCFMNWVNHTNDAYGHGHFDGLSSALAHEIAEAETDPKPMYVGSPPTGWGSAPNGDYEIADGCWYANQTEGSQYFAVQALYSNAAGTCATSYTAP